MQGETGAAATLRDLRCQRRAVLGRMRELDEKKRTYRASLVRGEADLQPADFWRRLFDEYQEAVDAYLELGAEIQFWQQNLQEQQ